MKSNMLQFQGNVYSATETNAANIANLAHGREVKEHDG